MTAALPLFPLGTVLFPGLVLPLRVFEPRYRRLVRDLLDLPEGTPREFGVIAIRRGWEVDGSVPGAAGEIVAGGEPTLYDVGCSAEIRKVKELPDGEFDLVTLGRRRFRVQQMTATGAPYLTAEVEWLTEDGNGERADELAAGVLAAFQRYLRLMRADAGDTDEDAGEQLPDDPTVLSHLVAATTSLTLDDRQRLLAAPDTVSRLRDERTLLRREVALLSRVRAVPIPLGELAVPSSSN
ncbi:MAG TPA: LON peptidase substrate-binding domain-containing protein [Micromonosporaceae bacterium]|nr:LON peptidase substrate-binding domain-containing protein [Micromonosporaceae bacterium]